MLSLRSTSLRHARRVLARAVLAPSIAVLSATACNPDVTRSTTPAPWQGERRLNVLGTSIQARVDGPGSTAAPTVVLLSGLDTPLEVWAGVRAPLSQDMTVLSYDRAGVGRSGATDSLRSASRVAAELHELLRQSGARPPYTLVAHSLAGIHARVFAARYPTLVSGLVLVDATHETLLDMMGPEDVEDVARSLQHPGARAEVRAQRRSLEELRQAALPDVPLVVLTSMIGPVGEPPVVREFLAGLQAEWLQLVTRGEQLRVAAGHEIPLEAPQTIVQAVRRVRSLASQTTSR